MFIIIVITGAPCIFMCHCSLVICGRQTVLK